MEYIELQREVVKINLPDMYALHWTSYDVNLDDTIEAFRTINTVSNWSEFREALSKMTVTPQNFIYGDIEGNIGHQHGGKLPLRNYGNGATVTPGTDEKFNWKGLVPFEKMFSIFNPEHGFVYTANYNEDKAPNGILIAQDRAKPYRQMRIKNLLQSKEVFSKQDFVDYQLDLYTTEAEELLPKLLKIIKSKIATKKHNDLITLLENWDYFLTRNSVAGAFYKVWYMEILRAILVPLIGKELFHLYLASNSYEIERLFSIYDEEIDKFEQAVFLAFENTIEFLTEKLSSDVTKWKWGNLHKVVLTHPFSQVNEEAKMLNIGPFKIGGDGNTLWNGSFDYTNDEFNVLVGPSYRQIHDLSDWDKSIGSIPGGQAGLPFHKHYNDLMKLWVKGKYVPLLFTRKAISENLEGTFKLIPQ
jgi:penicillin amidase